MTTNVPTAFKAIAALICAIIVATFWKIGDPPATAVFWPRAEVDLTNVEVKRWGASNFRIALTARDDAGGERFMDVPAYQYLKRDETGRIVFDDQTNLPASTVARGDQISVLLGPRDVMRDEGPGFLLYVAIFATLICVGVLYIVFRPNRWTR